MEKMVESQNMNYLNIRLPGIVGYQINDPRRPWLCKILNKLKNGQKLKYLILKKILTILLIVMKFINF